jgi:hypothetical protein
VPVTIDNRIRAAAVDGDGTRIDSFVGAGKECRWSTCMKARRGPEDIGSAKTGNGNVAIRAPLPPVIVCLDAYAEGDYSSLASFPSYQ